MDQFHHQLFQDQAGPNEMTGTELLIAALDRLKESEPEAMLIIWTDENGDISILSNAPNSHIIGLGEYAKHSALAGMTLKG